MQRPPHFALVDEADSVLIDEARTPLIISALPTEDEKAEVELYRWSAAAVTQFVEDEHYAYDHEKKTAELNAAGRRLVRNLPRNPALQSVGMLRLYDFIERAIAGRAGVSCSIGITSSATARSSSSMSSPAACRRGANGATACIRRSRPRKESK